MPSAAFAQRLAEPSGPLFTNSVGTFGERLGHALRVRGRSQRWLEREAKLAPGHASRLAGGFHNAPEPDTIERIADALGVDYHWLATGRGDLEPRATIVELDAPEKKGTRFGELPGWAEAEAEARARYDDIPGYAFDRAAASSGGRMRPSRIDAIAVAELARWWFNNSTREERREAERQEVALAVKKANKDAGRATPVPPSAKTLKPSKPAKLRRESAACWDAARAANSLALPVELVVSLPLDRYLRALLRRDFASACEEIPVYDFEDYRRMGRRFRARCDRPTRYPDPRHFAFMLGVTTVCEAISGECYGEINEGDEILYSCKGGPPLWGLRVYHGLAHWVLRSWYGDEYEESDAWLLTAELACDGDYLLEQGPERVITENAYVPAWLVRLYYAQLRVAA